MPNIVKFNCTNPLKNIYVYFLNTIIYLITCIILNKKIYQNKLNLVLYGNSFPKNDVRKTHIL